MPTRKKSATKSTAKNKKVAHKPLHRELSVKLTKDTDSFWNFTPTVQTIFWLVIGIAVICTAVINFDTNMRVNSFLNDIDAQNAAEDATPPPKAKPNY